MEINQNGISVSTLSEDLDECLEAVQKLLDSDYVLKPEGVIDNLMISLAMMDVTLQNQILYLTKQMDPLTAEGIYEDYLYERVGLYRITANPTKFFMTVTGKAGANIDAASLVIANSINKKEFANTSDFTIGDDGTADVEFSSIDIEDVPCVFGDTFVINDCPEGVEDIDSHSIRDIVIGNLAESDLDFRRRFMDIGSNVTGSTRNGILKVLSEYVNSLDFLSVDDANSDSSIPAGSLRIVAKPAVADEEFGKAILDCTLGGLNFIGNTTVSVPLSNGQNWEIKFQKASAVPVDLKVEIKIKNGYYRNSVFHSAQKNIEEFLAARIYGLKSTIYASEFIIPLLKTAGIEAVTELKIKRQTSSKYGNSVNMNYYEYPEVATDSIKFTY